MQGVNAKKHPIWTRASFPEGGNAGTKKSYEPQTRQACESKSLTVSSQVGAVDVDYAVISTREAPGSYQRSEVKSTSAGEKKITNSW